VDTEENDCTPDHYDATEHCFSHHRCTLRLKETNGLEARSSSPGTKGSRFALTKRELEIITLVAEGLTNKQAARRLHISEWTVASHLKRIFIKLGVESRTAMAHCCRSLLENR
jgi:DNA-binding NarL/FixJ family response regulator